ncbi:MAG: hypothetical protein AB2A00_16405 [Myxococcota bacterium]
MLLAEDALDDEEAEDPEELAALEVVAAEDVVDVIPEDELVDELALELLALEEAEELLKPPDEALEEEEELAAAAVDPVVAPDPPVHAHGPHSTATRPQAPATPRRIINVSSAGNGPSVAGCRGFHQHGATLSDDVMGMPGLWRGASGPSGGLPDALTHPALTAL